MSTLNARYGHTNLVARDWRSLAAFYEEPFGCVPVPPERDYRGPDLEAGTGVPGAALQGAHLRLPGHGRRADARDLPYQPELERPCRRPSTGRAWVTSRSRSMTFPLRSERCWPLAGRPSAKWSPLQTADGRHVTWCYVTDPEGNIVELQAWSGSG